MKLILEMATALALVCGAIDCEAADAEESHLVVARAIGSAPDPSVVHFIARNAQPSQYELRQRPDLQQLTIEKFAEMQCGSLQDGYLSELAAANALPLSDPKARIADSGLPGIWPACLYARESKKKDSVYTITTGDTLTSIRQVFTGSGAHDKAALNAFFAESDLSVKDSYDLQLGEKVFVPFTTAATELVPIGDSAQFAAGLKTLAGQTVVAEADPPPAGSIIGPVRFQSADRGGSIQNVFAACQPGDGTSPYPFNSAAIESAYAAALAVEGRQSNVTAVVVDNGFFGVRCGPAGCPGLDGSGRLLFDARFPGEFFDFKNFGPWGGLGPGLAGTGIDPLNYFNFVAGKRYYEAADVDAESGHGTHVAGLVLGGAGFLANRAAFHAGAKPWLRLVIANLSGGRALLGSASARNLEAMLSLIDGFKVINMSVAFDGSQDPTTAKTLASAFRDDSEKLVVAAAGNSGKNLEQDDQEFFPARLGGIESKSVLTVASVDGPVAGRVRLSDFSNRSSRYVDLAAPGCGVDSWLDGDKPEFKESGTSQAAPLVSFAATLLRSLWNAPPVDLKNRLLYSGDLLPDAGDRAVIRSMSSLNVEKALGFPWDRVTFLENGRERTLVGVLSLVQGLDCGAFGAVKPKNMRAFKRAEDGRLAIFRIDSSDRMQICWGRGDPAATLTLAPKYEIVDGRFVESAPDAASIAMSSVQEVIRAN